MSDVRGLERSPPSGRRLRELELDAVVRRERDAPLLRSSPPMAPRADDRGRRPPRSSSGSARRSARRARRRRPRRRRRSWRGVREVLLAASEEHGDAGRRASSRRHAARAEPGRAREVGDRLRACAAPTIHSGPSPAASKSSRNATVPGRGVSCTGSIAGQPSSPHATVVTKVSRPSAENARVMLRGRTPSSTQQPLAVGAEDEVAVAGVLDRPVVQRAETQRVLRRVLERPLGARGPRATLTPWPRSVPPSAIMRYHQSPTAVEVRRLGELPADARPERRGSSSARSVSRSTFTCRMPEVLAEGRQLRVQAEARVGDVGGAVLVPGEVGVDAVDCPIDADDPVAPRAGRVRRP